MDSSRTFRIQVQAARALAEWKAFFADQVVMQAKKLAMDGNPPGLITVDHYRQAGKIVVRSLETLLEEMDSSDGRQEAA